MLLQLLGHIVKQPGPALAGLWVTVTEEQLLLEEAAAQGAARSQGLAPAGMRMVMHHLREWGCPQPLMSQIESHAGGEGSSRLLLLALVWLAAHARVFERALSTLSQATVHLLGLVPPFPQVS